MYVLRILCMDEHVKLTWICITMISRLFDKKRLVLLKMYALEKHFWRWVAKTMFKTINFHF